MGNRAVVAVKGSSVGMYLHWNGGEESVRAFLRVAKDLGARDPVEDTGYFYARLGQIIGNWFGGTTSVGIDAIDRLDTDNGDNGVYWVGSDFEILGREHVPSHLDGSYSQTTSDEIYGSVLDANKKHFKEAA